MHLHLTLPLAYLATTLALPTTNTTSPLSKRDHYGFIGSFSTPTCHGEQVGSRPELHENECVKFAPATKNVGVNFGTGVHSLESVGFYIDDNCKQGYGGPAGDGVDKGMGDGKYGCWGVTAADDVFESVRSVMAFKHVA